MKNLTLAFVAVALIAATTTAQQLATNTAGHSLTSNGVTPTPGTPFEVNIGNGSSPIHCDLAGTAGSGVILGAGQLAAVSPDLGLGAGNEIDIDLGQPATILLNYLDPFAPLNFVIAPQIDPAGNLDIQFIATAPYLGLTVNLQAIIQDAAEPVMLGATATGSWTIIEKNILATNFGVDTTSQITPTVPIAIYGQTFASVTQGSHGYVRFATDNANEFAANGANFVDGTLDGVFAAAPLIAPLWSDLDGGEDLGGDYTAVECAPGVVRFEWNNFAPSFGAPPVSIGSFACTIDNSGGPAIITFDYTGLNIGATILNVPAVAGVSSGNTTVVPTVSQEVDLVTAGVVNAVAPTATGVPQTIFQDFIGLFAGQEDLDGSTIFFVDTDALGEGVFTAF